MDQSTNLNIFSWQGKNRTLHLAWIAFFITFFVWFNHAPLLAAIGDSLSLTTAQVKTLLILNVALTIPARVIIGSLTDRFGPRLVYSTLLFFAAIPCFTFAFAESYAVLAWSRFLLGFVGAGFVIGIRLMSDWFPAKELGAAEGIYGGWGNFGSAAGAMILPTIAAWAAVAFGGDDGWRYACALTGLISLVYSFVFYNMVRDTPKGQTYFKPKHLKGMEVTSVKDFALLIIMKIPMYLVLGLLAWKLSPAGVNLLESWIVYSIYAGLLAVFAYDCRAAFTVNRNIFTEPVPEIHQYSFSQVALLNILYFATFGSELAVVSMLPLFFSETFELSPVLAGLVASSYAFMNLMSRPGGGLISDKFGRKKTLIILTAGLTVGYGLMAVIDSTWSLVAAIVVTMACSFFVQAGEGAVFAVIPLIKRRLTGQIAGMTGAYGNVGAVVYLTVLSMVSYQFFFMFIAFTAALGFFASMFISEPEGSIVEVMPDGSLAKIMVT